MRRLNLTFAIILLAATVVFVGGGVLLWARNQGARHDTLVHNAEEAYEKKQLRTAENLYRQYLSQHPEDDARRARHALIAAEITKQPDVNSHDVMIAYNYLEAALRQNSLRDRVDLRRKLIDVELMIQGMVSEARKNIGILIAAGHSDPELEFLNARCAYVTNYFEDSASACSKLIGYDQVKKTFDLKKATDPKNLDAYVMLAALLRLRQDRMHDADAVIEQMVAANSKTALAYLKRSGYEAGCSRVGPVQERKLRLELAKDNVRRALEMDPKNVDAVLQNAQLCGIERDWEGAKKHFLIAQKLAPKDERSFVGLAGLHRQSKNYRAAIEVLEKGLQETPNSSNMVTFMQELQLQDGDVKGAKESLKRMINLNVDPDQVALATARIPLAEKRWLDAKNELEILLPKLNKNPTLTEAASLALANTYGILHQPEKQLELYTKIIQNNPRSVEAMAGKGSVLASLGRLEEALAVYQKDLLPVIGMQGFAGEPQQLLAFYNVVATLAQRNPQKESLKELRDKLAEHLKVQTTNEGAQAASMSKIADMLRDGKIDEALALLEKAIQLEPKNVRLQLGLVSLIANKKGVEAGLTRLAAVEKQFGDSEPIRKLRGGLLAEKGGAEATRQIKDLEKGLDKFSPTEQADLWSFLGQLYLRPPGNREEVVRCWQNALELDPQDSVLERLVEISRGDATESKILTRVAGILEKKQGRDSAEWKFAEATRLVSQVRAKQRDAFALIEARKLVEQAALQRQDWYLLVRLQGEINDLNGQAEAAMRDYQHSFEVGPVSQSVVQRLVYLQIQRGQLAEARKTLERLSNISRQGIKIKVGLDVESKDFDREKTLEDIAKAVPDDSQNPAEQMWKGQMLARLQQNSPAEAAFRRAVRLGPNLPEAWVTLIDFLSRAGKPQEAEEMVRQAENQLSDDQVPLVMAACYSAMGNGAQAEHYFLMALSKKPDSIELQRYVATYYLAAGQVSKAVPYLNGIMAAGPKLSGEARSHLYWARREMASLLVPTDDYPQFRYAVGLVEANTELGKSNAEDIVLLARLCSERREPSSLQQAQKLMEMLAARRALNFDENLLLAEIYIRKNQWEKGRTLLVELAAQAPKNARVLAVLSDALLKRGELDLAMSWIRQLQAIEPKSPSTLQLAGRLAAGRKRPEEVERMFNELLPETLEAKDAPRLVQLANLLEKSELYSLAEKRYRQLAELAPDQTLALAQFMARRNRPIDAMTILKSQITPGNTLAVCEIGTSALETAKQAGQAVPAELGMQLLSWVEKVKKSNPDSPNLIFVEARLFNVLGRNEEAEKSYRNLLTLPRINALTRAQFSNNLAFILALRGQKLDEAKRLIDSAIAQIGPVPELLDTRAMVWLAQGQADLAIKDLTDASEIDRNPTYIFHLALAYQKAHLRTEAHKFWRRARDEGVKKEMLSDQEVQAMDSLDEWLNS